MPTFRKKWIPELYPQVLKFNSEVQHTFSGHPDGNGHHLGLTGASEVHRISCLFASRLSVPRPFFLVTFLSLISWASLTTYSILIWFLKFK